MLKSVDNEKLWRELSVTFCLSSTNSLQVEILSEEKVELLIIKFRTYKLSQPFPLPDV